MMKPHWDKELFTNEGEGLTVGKLKEILANVPDDEEIILNFPTSLADDGTVLDREAMSVGHVDTHWHGAITFTEE